MEHSKGPNASIKGYVASTRAQAEIFFNEKIPKSYSQLCSNQDMVNLLNEANKKSGSLAKCFSDEDSYVVVSKLQPIQGMTGYFCVDSTNVAMGVSESKYASIVNANTLCQ